MTLLMLQVYNHRQSLYELSDEEILTAESPILASKSPRTRTPSKVMQVHNRGDDNFFYSIGKACI